MVVMYPFFYHLGNETLLVIALKIFDKGFDNLSGNAFSKSIGMSRGHIEVVFSLRIFASTSRGCTTGIFWSGAGVGEYDVRKLEGIVQ